jgi:hypothetical protein
MIMTLQIVAFLYYLIATIIVVVFSVLYLNMSIYMALPLVFFVAPMIAVYMVYRCCEDQ